MTTLAALLGDRFREEPDALFCELVDGEGNVRPVTVGEVTRRAMAFAARLGEPSPERRLVGVCLYHGLDLHAAFLGALWAGHIPTMLPPPSPRMEPEKYARQFAKMIEHVRPSALVCDGATLARLAERGLDGFADTEIIAAETVNTGAELAPAGGYGDDVALLQHSSGTTGLQKGVALSHRAILRHDQAYARVLDLSPRDRIASWLPLYHDMGFVACFLLPALERIPFIEVSPFDWVLRPALLLRAIHRARATLCWLPNFAYSFLAANVRESQLPADLDLSSVRAFVNSSEPVLDRSHRAFLDRFASRGARPEQLTASYAMAENVYAVTQSLPGELRVLAARRRPFLEEHRIEEAAPGEDALPLVGNGRTVPGTELRVVTEGGEPIPDGRVGEIVLRGEFRFDGYFRRDDLTAAALLPGGWYRTGDLGFVAGGEVYVTGRKKDLIIVQGKNIYPTDVEESVAQVPGVTAGRVVAFGIDDERAGTEGLVVLFEPADDAPSDPMAVVKAVRARVAQDLDLTPADVQMVPPRWLVKSTSGKLARGDNREKYLGERQG